MLSGTDLNRADLTSVNLASAFLKKCNFEKAVMKDVQFGVFPDLECGFEVTTVAMGKEGNLMTCGTENG